MELRASPFKMTVNTVNVKSYTLLGIHRNYREVTISLSSRKKKQGRQDREKETDV